MFECFKSHLVILSPYKQHTLLEQIGQGVADDAKVLDKLPVVTYKA
jgi:hypothetical protein